MQNNKGLDAISMLTDILFQDTDGPTPSFPENKRKVLAKLGLTSDEKPAPPEPSTTLAWE